MRLSTAARIAIVIAVVIAALATLAVVTDPLIAHALFGQVPGE